MADDDSTDVPTTTSLILKRLSEQEENTPSHQPLMTSQQESGSEIKEADSLPSATEETNATATSKEADTTSAIATTTTTANATNTTTVTDTNTANTANITDTTDTTDTAAAADTADTATTATVLTTAPTSTSVSGVVDAEANAVELGNKFNTDNQEYVTRPTDENKEASGLRDIKVEEDTLSETAAAVNDSDQIKICSSNTNLETGTPLHVEHREEDEMDRQPATSADLLSTLSNDKSKEVSRMNNSCEYDTTSPNDSPDRLPHMFKISKQEDSTFGTTSSPPVNDKQATEQTFIEPDVSITETGSTSLPSLSTTLPTREDNDYPTNRTPTLSHSTDVTAPPSTTTTVTQQMISPTTSTSVNTASATSSTAANTNANTQQNGYRPLNVKDALTYLDQVKVQFSDHPEVYNKFLDIMKDFKSQAIDTPGVIERVSTLFRGHPLLISGFNTFLPPGYCIECITDEQSHDIIRVTTPNGTTTTNAGEPLRLGSETTGTPTHEQLYYGYNNYGSGRSATATVYGDSGHGTPMTIHHLQHPGQQHLPPTSSTSSSGLGQQHPHHLHQPRQQQQPHHLHHASLHHQHPHTQSSTHSAEDGVGSRRAPVEFNHAINYVNKIKNRFSSDPDIYKQFLEILQTYQKEQRPIQEVYSQVQVLFNGDNDLLAEFKQFLPDTTGGASTAVYTSTPHGRKGLMMVPGLPNVSQGRKKRGTTMLTSGLSKRNKLQNKMDTQTSEVRSGMSVYQETIRPFVSGEEVEFFEKVKKYIGSKTTYNAFLKVLNLFSQQIVDQNVLVNRVEGFIGGNKELFDMFKNLVGYDGKDEIVENIPADMDKPDLSQCRSCGPSYRLIPKAWEQSQVCSGKDELCLEVLNDRYISHPTWASEDSGYVASKKNQYEEALHRVEEERYDYDLNIEANLNTIALLEPIMKKISAMSPEEKVEFTLPVGLGGPSKTIYQRIIKKIYGNEKGLQVIGLLHSNPAQTVPIVLKRLKQKDDEWKRAQREWNKIWREVEAKNYLKSLDYQGITFKSNDKRRITTKHLTMEIEERRTQQQEEYQQQMQDRDVTSILLAPARKPPQFTFDFKQISVLKDVIRLIYYFFERTELYSAENQDKMRTFMETLLPLVFDVDTVLPDGLADNVNGAPYTNLMEDGNDNDETMGGEENDREGDGTVDDDEAGDEADDEEDEETRSIQSYDSDGDAIMGSRSSNESASRMTRRGAKRQNGSRRKLMDILTRNMQRPSSPPPPTSTTSNTQSALATTDAVNTDTNPPSDAENDPKQSSPAERDADVDVPDVANENASDKEEQQGSTANGEDYPAILTSDQKNGTSNDQSKSANKRHVYNLFADSEFYCFFRLYQLIYDRLCQMKTLDEEYKKDPIKIKYKLKSTLNVAVKSKRVAGYQFNFSNGYYQALLTLIEKFFEGEVDQQAFEDLSRYIFGNKAYVLFTIDKVVLALIRHTHLIVSNDKTSHLLDLFKQNHDLEHVDAQILGDYRLRIEEVLGKDEALFNIAFDTIRRSLSIQILGENDDFDKNTRDDYEEYVSNYIDWANATKGINTSDLTPRFLKRNVNRRIDDDTRQSIMVRSGMQYKICRDTYHMFYIIGTEDVFVRLPPTDSASVSSTLASSITSSSVSQSQKKSSEKWRSWLESEQGWSQGVLNKEQAEKEARQLLFS